MVQSFLKGRYQVLPLETDPPKFGGAVDFWALEPLLVAHNTHQNALVRRDPTTSLGSTVRFRLTTHGRMQGLIEGKRFLMEAGDVGFDANEAGRVVEVHDFSCVAFSVSAASVGYDPGKHVAWRVLDRDDPTAIIFANAAEAFLDRLPTASATEADRMGNVMLGLIRGMIGGLTRTDSPDVHASRSFAIRQFIDENLADPTLGIETLIGNFAMSRSVIYRDFEEHSGVSRYIMTRRMARGLHMLLGRDEDLRIVEIAKAVGFPDQRHFARCFRKHFGISPTQARRQFVQKSEIDQSISDEPIRIGQHKRALLSGRQM